MATTRRKGWTFRDDGDAFERRLRRAADAAVDRTARAVLREAAELAPVDTSALQTSGHVVSPLRNDYSSAVAAARAANPKVEFEPAITPEDFGDDVSAAVVHFPVDYASFVEEGHYSAHIGQYQRPQEFLQPALQANEETFAENAQRELRKAGITAQKR